MSTASTRAPARAKASALARPMPDAAAVTTAVLPASRSRFHRSLVLFLSRSVRAQRRRASPAALSLVARQSVIRAHELAHRPVAAPHQARGPESIRAGDRRTRASTAGSALPASVTRPESLQTMGVSRASAAIPRFHSATSPPRERRLGAVIQHHGEIRVSGGEFEQRRQMLRQHQRVEHQAMVDHGFEGRRELGRRSIQSGSGMSWIIGRRPTSCGPRQAPRWFGARRGSRNPPSPRRPR